MLDILANGFAEFRTDFDAFRTEMYDFRSEMYDFRTEMYEFRTEMYEFRKGTSANFNRLERRRDNHETRITNLERRTLSS